MVLNVLVTLVLQHRPLITFVLSNQLIDFSLGFLPAEIAVDPTRIALVRSYNILPKSLLT
jgi:hypothetical protein